MSRTLFDISDEMRAVEAALYSEAGLDAEGRAQAMDAYLEGNEELQEKLDSYAALIRICDARTVVRRVEATRLAALAKADETLADELRARLLIFFRAHRLGPINTRRYCIAVHGNGGKQPLRVNVPVADLPIIYRRIPPEEANLEALRLDLENGEVIPGVELLPRGEHVSIR